MEGRKHFKLELSFSVIKLPSVQQWPGNQIYLTFSRFSNSKETLDGFEMMKSIDGNLINPF